MNRNRKKAAILAVLFVLYALDFLIFLPVFGGVVTSLSTVPVGAATLGAGRLASLAAGLLDGLEAEIERVREALTVESKVPT